MTDDATTARAAAAAALPGLQGVTAELEKLLTDLLSPAVIAALAAAPGAMPPAIAGERAQEVTARAAQLLAVADTRIAALQAETV